MKKVLMGRGIAVGTFILKMLYLKMFLSVMVWKSALPAIRWNLISVTKNIGI